MKIVITLTTTGIITFDDDSKNNISYCHYLVLIKYIFFAQNIITLHIYILIYIHISLYKRICYCNN